MSARPHAVALVVDPEFGERLVALSSRMHVWVLDTSTNRAVAERVWRADRTHSLESGITTFKAAADASAEEIAIAQLPTIDLHHGDSSHTPAWSVLEVYGAHASVILLGALREFGFTNVRHTAGA